MSTLIVTRHQGLVDYLVAKGFVTSDVEVVEHASADIVTGKHVWGVLPHSLSVLCSSFTEVPLSLPAELRGKELSMAEVEQYAGKPVTYMVNTVEGAATIASSWFLDGIDYQINREEGEFIPTWDWEAIVLNPEIDMDEFITDDMSGDPDFVGYEGFDGNMDNKQG